MAYAELEIRIQFLFVVRSDARHRDREGAAAAPAVAPRHDASLPERYRIDARFNHSGSDVDYRPERVEVDIDLATLPDPADDERGYGHAVWEFLFADPSLRTQLDRAVERARRLGIPLRIRLFIDPTDAKLHGVRWELLRDPAAPADHGPLTTDEQVLFSRYISSADTRDVQLRPRGALRALVVVASPIDVERYAMEAIDVDGEVARARASLAGITVSVLASRGEATLERLLDRLRERPGYDVLYLVCHGRIVDGTPWLWLETMTGETNRVSGDELAVRIGKLWRSPSLVVLASCQSAGPGVSGRGADAEALVALGPKLTAQGTPAVLGMQGDFTTTTNERFMPRFFQELMKSGHIDYAVTIARGEILDRPDWWMPVLFTRLKGGRIWYSPGFRNGNDKEEMWDTLIDRIQRGGCTPVLGPGITDAILGSRREIALRWAEAHHYPMALHQHESLPQVAQFIEVNRKSAFLRDQFIDQLGNEVCDRYRDRVAGLDARCADPPSAFTAKGLDELISVVGGWQRRENEHEPHRVLASLRLPLYITANVSNLLTDALEESGASPRADHCRWRDAYVRLADPADVADHEVTRDQPLVYHLYGRIVEPRDVVLTEDDFFGYLIAVASERRMIPKVVSGALMDSALLFIGFSLDDWTFRVLYQLILSQQGAEMLKDHRHVAVQIDPDEGRTQYPDRARQYFERYFGRNEISLYWGSAQDFVEELSRRWENVS
jgi:hypothetical protein